jgi:hypothetical protein
MVTQGKRRAIHCPFAARVHDSSLTQSAATLGLHSSCVRDWDTARGRRRCPPSQIADEAGRPQGAPPPRQDEGHKHQRCRLCVSEHHRLHHDRWPRVATRGVICSRYSVAIDRQLARSIGTLSFVHIPQSPFFSCPIRLKSGKGCSELSCTGFEPMR